MKTLEATPTVDMKALVIVESVTVNSQVIDFKSAGNEIYTDSLTVARVFEMRHDNVLKAVDTDINRLPREVVTESNSGYVESAYIDVKGETRKLYYMTKKNFTFLVMGFRGAKANQFKRQYVEAFEAIVESHRQVTAEGLEWKAEAVRLKEEAKAREQSLLPKTRETLDQTRKIHLAKIENYFIAKGENPEVFTGMMIRSYMLLHILVIGDIPANIVKDRVCNGIQSINSSHKMIRLRDCTIALNYYTNEEMELFNDTLLPTLRSMSDAILTNKYLTPRLLVDSLENHLRNQLLFMRNINKGDLFQGKNRVDLDALVERLYKCEISVEVFTDSVIGLKNGRTFVV